MEQSFTSHRFSVTIKIENGLIEFFRTEHLQRHNEWLNDLSEYEFNELDDEQKQFDNFYWIEVANWISDFKTKEQGRQDNWHYHIKGKNWFTDEMYNWLNKNLIK